MKLTLIHPCLGRIPGKDYIKSWQMEPLPMAYIKALTPSEVEVDFWDDRLEEIPYEIKTDAVAISVETYTAKRAYQIASEYRKRGVPVIMGGFHATLLPEEVRDYAEAVIVGEAESIWHEVINDLKNGCLKRIYKSDKRPDLSTIIPDRSIFKNKTYLPISLVEANRGCTFKCDFCAIQTAFNSTQTKRPVELIVKEIKTLDRKRMFFFVDDNMVSDIVYAKELFKALTPLKIKWVSQASINMTYDDELLKLMSKSGCQGVLVGFESLNPDNLKAMNKGFNLAKGGLEKAVKQLHKHKLLLYATFVFGREYDTMEGFNETLQFCIKHKIFIVAFNHMTPFPATPFYEKLKADGKMLYDQWWLDDRYKYGEVPFKLNLDPKVVQDECVRLRKEFYSLWSVIKRFFVPTSFINFKRIQFYVMANLLLHREATQRENYPLGDLNFKGEILKVKENCNKVNKEDSNGTEITA